jgi:DNA-directed RNA polymerase, beta subunit/140 kD subunit
MSTLLSLLVLVKVDMLIVSTRRKLIIRLSLKSNFRKFSKYREGDKEAFRYSQKGTVGRIEKRENLIRVADGPNKGMTPDLIFNPHGFPSRQTMGILLEGLITKAAMYNGERVNVSAFRKVDVEKARQTLMENGMDPDGYEIMEKPGDTKMKGGRIYFVPLYTQALKHHVMDKISMRSSGQRNIYTHQPRGGRTQGGAQKVGEMEKDSFVAHGAAGVIIDRMRICSDEFKMAVCNNCGNILHKKRGRR